MRSSLILLTFIAGCSSDANPNGYPITFPVNALTSAHENAVFNERRGRVELSVKSNFDQIIPDINAGGGPALDEAIALAGIPESDRPTRIIQLRNDVGRYANNPGALVTVLMVYGST